MVIIIDNDDGANEIKKKLKVKNGDEIKDFYHFAENLYILIIPKDEGKAIEDLFDPKILRTKIDGKDFNRGKEIDAKKEYGKIVFAEKVVKEKQQHIDFVGFKEVFDRLRLTIDDYRNKKV